ncbi:MAG: hypothetical protein EB060_00470 [Proteobacteria bacterium]|nr:hypothetical protein [Pseudomonadota bacterium]
MQKRILTAGLVFTKPSKNGATKNYGDMNGATAKAILTAVGVKLTPFTREEFEATEVVRHLRATRRARNILNSVFPGSGLPTGEHLVIGPPVTGPVVVDDNDCWELPPTAIALAAVGEDISKALTEFGKLSGLGEVAKAVPPQEDDEGWFELKDWPGEQEVVFELPPPPPPAAPPTDEDDEFGFELPKP